MAHTFGTSGSTALVSLTTLTGSYTPPSGSTVLVVSVFSTAARTGGTPTFGGTNLVDSGFGRVAYATNPEVGVEVFYLLDPAAAAASFSIPNSGGTNVRAYWSTYLAGTGKRSRLHVSNSATGLSATGSCPLTSSVDGVVMFQALGHGAAARPTSSHTNVGSFDEGAYSTNTQYNLQATAGAVNLFFYAASDDWQTISLGFAETPRIYTDNGSITLSGQTVAPKAGRVTTTSNGSFSLSGQAVTFTKTSAGKTLAVDFGSLSLSGQAVTPKAGRSVAATNGSLTLSGQIVTAKAGRALSVDNGSLTLSGQTVTPKAGRALSLDNGSLTLSGQTVSPIAGRSLSVANGAIVLSGQDITLTRPSSQAYSLTVDFGSFVHTGQAVGISRNIAAAISAGSLSVSGQSVSIFSRRRIAADRGAITLSGQGVAFSSNKSLHVEAGSISLYGPDVNVWADLVRLRRHAPYNQIFKSDRGGLEYSLRPRY